MFSIIITATSIYRELLMWQASHQLFLHTLLCLIITATLRQAPISSFHAGGTQAQEGKAPKVTQLQGVRTKAHTVSTSPHCLPHKTKGNQDFLQSFSCFVCFAFSGHTCGIWKFPGQRSNRTAGASHSNAESKSCW